MKYLRDQSLGANIFLVIILGQIIRDPVREHSISVSFGERARGGGENGTKV